RRDSPSRARHRPRSLRSNKDLGHARAYPPPSELRDEFIEREQPHAGRGAAQCYVSAQELLCEENGRHARNFGAMITVGHEMPVDAGLSAILLRARKAYPYAPALTAQVIKPGGGAIKGGRPSLQRYRQTRALHLSNRRQQEMLHTELKRRAKLNGSNASISHREKLQIGYVAGGGPPRAKLAQPQATEFLPPVRRAPRSIGPPLERVAEITEDRPQSRGPARCALCRGDADLDFIEG